MLNIYIYIRQDIQKGSIFSRLAKLIHPEYYMIMTMQSLEKRRYVFFTNNKHHQPVTSTVHLPVHPQQAQPLQQGSFHRHSSCERHHGLLTHTNKTVHNSTETRSLK